MNSVFEIIGPAMVGPSSSHTAGAVRIGLLARQLLGEAPVRVRIGLHGSFAATGKGHATDRGLISGLLLWQPDDERLKEAIPTAEAGGMEIAFEAVDLGEIAHPNTARLELEAASGRGLTLTAASVGGGNVEVSEVDGFVTHLSGALDTLVVWHQDKPGFLANITAVFACVSANIATIRTARRHRGSGALTVIELDAPPQPEVAALLDKIDHVERLCVLPRLL